MVRAVTKGKEKRLLSFGKLLPNRPRKYPRKTSKKDSYRTYIRSSGSIEAVTVDINRRKKETITPLSSLPSYL